MALVATVVTLALANQVDTWYAKLQAGFDPTNWGCSLTAADLPSAAAIKFIANESPAVQRVVVFTDGSEAAGMAIFDLRNSGRFAWLVANATYSAGVLAFYNFACAYALQQFGAAYGVVANPRIQAQLQATGRYAIDLSTDTITFLG